MLIGNPPTNRINAKLHGAVCNRTTDDSAALQSAINQASAQIAANGGGGIVEVPWPGCAFDTQLDLKDVSIEGIGPFGGTVLKWTGSTGSTAVVSGSAGFGNSAKVIRGIEFAAAAANEPGTWLDFTADSVDAQCIVERVAFGRCSGDAVKTGSWVNAHWRNLRWDNCGGYAIRLTPSSSQALSNFDLAGFTYDHSRTSGAGSGVLLIDNTANAAQVGVVRLASARVEINQTWGGNKALVTIKGGATFNPATAKLHLADLAVHDNASMTGETLVYRETTENTRAENVVIENVWCGNYASIFAGTWPSQWKIPAMPADGYIGRVDGGANGLFVRYWQGQQYYLFSATSTALRTFAAADTVPRYLLDASGKASWSDGTNTADTTLYRTAANQLKSDDTLIAADGIVTKTKAGAPTDADFATTPPNGTIVIDTTNSKIYVRIGGAWVATAALT